MAMKLYNPGRERPLNKTLAVWFILVHLLAVIAVWYLLAVRASEATIVMTVVLFFLVHLSITAGSHRLYSHKAFEASVAYEYAVAVFYSGAMQGYMRWWAQRHRQHHSYSDTENDPYTVLHGFWWAHILWILHDPMVLTKKETSADLARNSVLDWQEKYARPLSLGVGVVLPTILGSLWNDLLGGLLIGGFLRLFFQYHFTFAINSVAHKYGKFRFVPAGTARTQAHWMWLPVVTVGEATSHERHHLAQEDYRIDSRWWSLDVGKWSIWLLSLAGITWGLRRVPEEVVHIRAQKKLEKKLD